MRTRRVVGIGCLFSGVFSSGLAGGLAVGPASGAAAVDEAVPQPACSGPEFGALDFWLGEWEVYVGAQRVGSDRVEKVLDGCAITETWTDARGSEGRSLFWVSPADGRWHQVWVTASATAPGGTKEKARVDAPAGVRFQGEIPLPDGGSYLDRTTLTPLEGGRVRQLIEVSGDGGRSWEARFDAVYVPG